MLGKQAWRFAKQPNSLWCQVMKSLYYPQGDFWTAHRGNRPSWGWQSLLEGREVIEPATRWKVGDEQKIRIREDVWLPTGRIISSANKEDPKMVVDLIDKEIRAWDMQRVKEFFPDSIVKEILTHPLSLYPNSNKLVWTANKLGTYTIKSGYKCINNPADPAISQNPSSSYQIPKSLWQEIWSLPTSPKIRFLLWNICSNSLPTKANLYRREMIPDPTCQICGQAPETTEHIFILCTSRTGS